MVVDRNGLEVLDREQSLGLLRTATLGRVGLTAADGTPVVLPVNFCLDDDRILLLTSGGTKLDAARREATVAFEVDDFDPMYHSGWSVVVNGTARTIRGAEARSVRATTALARWAREGDCHIVAISLDQVSGRRLGPG